MWDQNVLNQLIDWLNEEGRQLRKNKNYDGYKLLRDAVSEIVNWLGTQIPQEVETRLYALIGAERLNRFLSERNIEIGQVAPPQTDVLAGSKSESVGQTIEPNLQPSGAAFSASSVSSVPNIDPAGSPGPVRGPAVESENGEDPLLAKLREVKNRKGEITLERLADYLKDLGQAAQDWKNKHPGASTEANEALSIVQDGQNLLDQVARKTQIEADFAKAEASRNLRAARALLHDVDTILKKAQGSLGLFGTAAAAAEREFDGVRKDLETRRAKVAVNLGKYLTIGVSNLAKRLDELDELIQNNVPYVPDDKGGEQATTSVFRETRVMFIEQSIEKANKLKVSIKAALDASTDQFDSAARDCETALSWFESKHIKDQFANDPLVLELKSLSSKIEDLKKQREATARWSELASSMDGVRSLYTLAEARKIGDAPAKSSNESVTLVDPQADSEKNTGDVLVGEGNGIRIRKNLFSGRTLPGFAGTAFFGLLALVFLGLWVTGVKFPGLPSAEVANVAPTVVTTAPPPTEKANPTNEPTATTVPPTATTVPPTATTVPLTATPGLKPDAIACSGKADVVVYQNLSDVGKSTGPNVPINGVIQITDKITILGKDASGASLRVSTNGQFGKRDGWVIAKQICFSVETSSYPVFPSNGAP